MLYRGCIADVMKLPKKSIPWLVLLCLAGLLLVAQIRTKIHQEDLTGLDRNPAKIILTAGLKDAVDYADFLVIRRSSATSDSFISELHSLTRSAQLPFDSLRVNPGGCDVQTQTIPTTCLQATLTGSYPQIKSLLNDLQSRHPQQLILRGLRMQRRDAALGTVTAELDLLLLGAGKAAEGATPAAEAARAAP